jgi:hypothetical protein
LLFGCKIKKPHRYQWGFVFHLTAKDKIDGDIPVISGGQKPAYYNAQFNRDGEIITIAGSGAYAGYVQYWNQPIFVSDAFSVKPYLSVLSIRYVFHILLKNQNWIYSLKKGVGVPHVYPKDLAKLNIPIPCPNNPKKSLEIQNKIVRILDNFTELTGELTGELTAELIARKKQYTFYREQLFSFNEVEYTKIIGKSFRVVIVEYTPGYIPFLSKKDGTDIQKNLIYIRKNASSEQAEYNDLQDIFNRRLETSFSSAREISLTEHFKELKEIYSLLSKNIITTKDMYSFIDTMRILSMSESKPNPKYPKEDYDDFVVRMLNLKKSVIESIIKSDKFFR